MVKTPGIAVLLGFLVFFGPKKYFEKNFTWTADVHVTLRRLAQKNENYECQRAKSDGTGPR
jgi:hypothetical protein